MTYKTKNATIVFAIVALLMAAPLAVPNANGSGEGLLNALCGFTEPLVTENFGALTRGASSVTEQTVVFQPTESSSGTGTIFVVADDWFGLGARAEGTITINSNIVSGETFGIHGVTYTGDDAASGDIQFLTGAAVTGIQSAASLAAAINSGDGGATGVIATTSGTNVVTVKSQVGGALGGGLAAFDLTYTGTGNTVVSGAGTFTEGGTGSTTPHMNAETTKFFIINDGTSNADGSKLQNYDTLKTAMPGDGDAALEMISGTTSNEFVEISFEISTGFIDTATAKIVMLAVEADDTVTLDGLEYTAIAGVSTGQSFQIGLTDDQDDAAELVSTINGAQSRLTAALDFATGTAALLSVADGDVITINELIYTAESDGAALAEGEFAVELVAGDDDISDAAGLAAAINIDTRSGTLGDLSATSSGNVVTITTDESGLAGNAVLLDSSESTITESGTTLLGAIDGVVITFDTAGDIGNIIPIVTAPTTGRLAVTTGNAGFLDGGTEHLLNLPYDGALTQTLAFTIVCEGV